ncbi:MAG: hypothetical protein LBB23_00365 [Rickettsiales bacterium]|jgi:hypothetical protein|nr:hypothetical protein [Rickettsiales bacterium]
MKNIKILGIRSHSKASEKYVDVVFKYGNKELSLSVPTEYRRTGIDISDDQIDEYLQKVYDEVNPANWDAWKTEQTEFWKKKSGAKTTKPFFDILSKNFGWCCVDCTLPKNPNWARRIQDIKEFGYTLATNTNMKCPKCKKNKTHIMLLPIKRGGVSGYETWSPELRQKIIKILNSFDAFEARTVKPESLLPDHKFPEIRWDLDTKRDSLESMTAEEIKKDFQLLSNQRNQQKREICRNCYQTGKRGTIYGIDYYSKGGKDWKCSAKIGKVAESGCIGCPWYDIESWRKELNKLIKKG